MSAIIKIEDLHYTYPGDEAETLKGIDLEIEEGSFVAVLGHNGSGKSTLAKHFNAILTPTEGKVLVDGMDTADENNLLAVRRTVGMVFQNPDNQIVANVVEDDVAFAPENLGVPSGGDPPPGGRRPEARGHVRIPLATRPICSPAAEAAGGHRRRHRHGAPGASCWTSPPPCWTPRAGRRCISTVHGLNRDKGITVVLITHHMNECGGADRLDRHVRTAAWSWTARRRRFFTHVELWSGRG
jgi:energy-coupling factor transport system ATP-binding protein